MKQFSIIVMLNVLVAFLYLPCLADGFPKGNLIRTASGLQYGDIVVGTGASPSFGKQVTVKYLATLRNGKIFDSSDERNVSYSFKIGSGQVIAGFEEGIMSMKVGGRRVICIPANLAYGAKGYKNGIVPANTEVVFGVELLDVK